MKSETKTSSSDPNRMAINKQSRANRGTRARGVGRIRAILLTVAAVLLVPLWIRDAVAEGADGSLEHAIAAQQARIEASPEDAAAIKDLGNLYLLAGHRDRAEEAYREAIRIDPGDAGAHYNLALLLKDTDPKAALRLLRSTIELQPAFAWAHYTLGSVYQSLGRRAAAIKSYATAFSANPDLALPEVNPDVIGNPDTTAALIMANPDQGLGAATPRDYADPQRIAGLLIGHSQPHPAGETENSALESAAPESSVSTSRNSPELDGSDRAEQPTTQEDLETARANEPVDAQRESAPGTAVPAPRTLRVDDLSDTRTNQATPQPSARSTRRGGSRSSAKRPPNSRFRPGRRSSARLDLEVVPGGWLPAPARSVLTRSIEVGSPGR